MKTNDQVTRRNFLTTTGVAAAGATAMTARSYAQTAGANDRLHVGFIGCGGMAGAHLGSLIKMKDAENLSLDVVCDVYESRANKFRGGIKDAGGNAKVARDYREVLARKDLDYVVIATPEHSHAYITLDALDAGKHVYVEKPMTHTIDESQRVTAKVNDTELKLQVGVQSMADDSYSSARTAIEAGKIGNVVQAQVDYVRYYSPSLGPWRKKGITDDMEQPSDLDWNAWLKPARKRPWNPHHYYEWRNYSPYSGGIATDLFIHRVTRILKACNLTFPTRAVGMGGITIWPDGRDLPDNFEMLLEYPAIEGITKGMTVYTLGTMANKHSNRHCIRGDKATLYFTGKGWEIKDQQSGEIVETHTKTGGEDVTPHHKNHHAAIREDAELNCPAELGMYGVACVRMANLSWFKRKMIEWNPKRGKATVA